MPFGGRLGASPSTEECLPNSEILPELADRAYAGAPGRDYFLPRFSAANSQLASLSITAFTWSARRFW